MDWFLGDTKEKIDWDKVLHSYVPQSQVAQKMWKKIKPFIAGEEKEWLYEMKQVEIFIQVIKRNKTLTKEWETLFSQFYDQRIMLHRLLSEDWQGIDLLMTGYHLKQFLWFSHRLSQGILANLTADEKESLKDALWFQMVISDWKSWLERFSTMRENRNFYPHFAMEDLDGESLLQLRKEKRSKIRQLKGYEKELRLQIEQEYEIKVNFERYLLLPNEDVRSSQIASDSRFYFVRHQGEEKVFYLLHSKEEQNLLKELEELENRIRTEEEENFFQLLKQILPTIPLWLDAHEAWGKIEILLKKAVMAIDFAGTQPILKESGSCQLAIRSGFHPYFQTVWKKKHHGMKPISIDLAEKATVLYGGNMNGKSVVLKTLGLMAALAQHGFYVPAEEFHFSFVSHLSLISGDFQDIENGLSSFGAEMVRLRQDLAYSENILYLIDEIGKGTNPVEGEALTVGLLRYLYRKNRGCSVLVTHFPNVLQEEEIRLYEVKQFQLIPVEQGKMVFEAISIAEKLELPAEIINHAKEYLQQRKTRGKQNGKSST